MKAFRYPPFIMLPNAWIEQQQLTLFKWKNPGGGDHIAALLCLIAIAHRVDDHGVAKVTYDDIAAVIPMSRAKISAAIKVLVGFKILAHEPDGQSTFKLVGFGEGTWGKLPAKALYKDGRIWAFAHFSMRKAVELHALKIYLLFVSRRNTKTNEVRLAYPKIAEYAGVPNDQIKAATSLLIENHLISVDSITDWNSWASPFAQLNCYRVAFVDPYINRGTQRGSENYLGEIDIKSLEKLP